MANFSIYSQKTKLTLLRERIDAERERDGTASSGTNTEAAVTPPTGASGGSSMSALTSTRAGTYYIYTFDGRLLAEYDIYGICLKEYIYMGSRLIAEYNPSTSQYFYYTQDQIGSTRIVTDDTCNVVYAAAHDPYGGIQKVWKDDFDPKRKFSDKERDGETGLDYFGARYYNRAQYRFISADPIYSVGAAISDPQSSNRYTYCRNNPVKYLDPDGLSYIIFCKYNSLLYIYAGDGTLMGVFSAHNDVARGKDPFPTGTYGFSHWNWQGHIGAAYNDGIDSWGSICFWTDLNGDGIRERDMAIHSGGLNGWTTKTNGCIRTTPLAMFLLWVLEACGDRIDYLLVTDYYVIVGGGTGPELTQEELKEYYRQYVILALALSSFSNMINDYFFWYGPIPPWI